MTDPLESPPPSEAIAGETVPHAQEGVLDLSPLVERAVSIHPHLTVPRERFLAFLRRCLREAKLPLALDALHMGDLYLACAYGLGVEAAQREVEAEHFTRIRRRLDRLRTPPAIVADVLQELRCRLVEMQQPDFAGRAYVGRGSLGGWLFIAAIRIAERRTGRAHQELSGADGILLDAQERLLPALDPEMEHLISSYKEAFEAALQEGLAALSCRERNILRYHFIERLSIDRLAEIYDVHRATAARWIARAQSHLADEIRSRFTAQIPVAEESVPRLIALIRSRLDFRLSAALSKPVEAEM